MIATKATIFPIHALKDNYIWALVDERAHTVLVVDPGEATPVFTFLATHSLDLAGVLITHHHWDHTHGISELKARHDVPVAFSAKEKTAGGTWPVSEGDDVHFPQFSLYFHVIDIPGHTLGHVAYYTDGALFCGDTLFGAGCGRLFEGTADQLYSSLQKCARLPDDTKVYCGHEYTLAGLQFAKEAEPSNKQITTRLQQVTALRDRSAPSLPTILAEEKATNPFLRCHVPEVIQQAERFAGRQLAGPVEVFAALRKWKDTF